MPAPIPRSSATTSSGSPEVGEREGQGSTGMVPGGAARPIGVMHLLDGESTVTVMSLLAQFTRQAVGLGSVATEVPAAHVPMPCAVAAMREVDARDDADIPQLDTARFLAEALLGDPVSGERAHARLEAAVDEQVTVWTPAVQVASRLGLVALLADSDDAIGGIDVAIAGALGAPAGAVVEWVVTGRFTGPVLLADDRLIEPSGAPVRVCGVLSAAYAGERAIRISLYYDRMALLQQILPQSGTATR